MEREREIQIYTDPLLSRNRKGYERFIRTLYKLGLVCFVRDKFCAVGLFFVKKKETQQRMIMDCRMANRFFQDPPGVSMCTSESLARIEVMLPETVDPFLKAGIARMRGAQSPPWYCKRFQLLPQIANPEVLVDVFCLAARAGEVVWSDRMRGRWTVAVRK